MQIGSWDPQGLIYFKNCEISYANKLLGIPRPAYLYKFVISYSNVLQRVPKKKSLMIPRLTYLKRSVTSSKWAPPGSFTLRNQWFLMQVSSWEFIYLRNHIYIYIYVLCNWAPGAPRAHPLKKTPWISYANELLEIPGIIYLKKMPCNIYMCAQGGPCTYRNKWFLMQMSSWGSPGSFT